MLLQTYPILGSTGIGLGLISMNFLNSDFITRHELPELLKKAAFFLNVEKSIAHLDPHISGFQHVNDPKDR